MRYKLPESDKDKLNPGVMLNDNVMNYALAMLQERISWHDIHDRKISAPSVHVCNTHFYTKIARQRSDGKPKRNVQNVPDLSAMRWFEHLGYDVADCDRVLVPVHFLPEHWVLHALDLREGVGNQALRLLQAQPVH